MNVSRLNSHYWNQLCGSRAARKLGISPGDPNGVAIFDEWFFAFYPYVADDRFIPWSTLGTASVLEIGLGYGSVTRRLGSVAKSVVACDISPGPVGFAHATTSRVAATQASALDLPFCSESFDVVVSLGCLHHTGDLHRSLRECLRVVKPGGLMVVMVYNRYSYKRWIVAPLSTWQSWRQERRGRIVAMGTSAPRRVSWFWDRSPSGSAPPHTEFASRDSLQTEFSDVSSIRTNVFNVDNINDLLPMRIQWRGIDKLRVWLLETSLSRRLGLDLYCVITK